jgi:delta endotoxin, N-terminal domain
MDIPVPLCLHLSNDKGAVQKLAPTPTLRVEGGAIVALNYDDPNEVLNFTLKLVITQALDHIPVVGEILGAIAEAIWPDAGQPPTYTPGQMFDALKDRISGLIGQAISKNDVAIVQAALSGMSKDISNYMNAVTGDELNQFDAARDSIDLALPQFQLKGQEVVLLPLYTQAVNAHLAFLRHGYMNCMSWPNSGKVNMQKWQAQLLADLQSAITAAVKYTATTYASGLTDAKTNAPVAGVPVSSGGVRGSGAARFNYINDYIRETTLAVLDYAELWPFFDPVAYPNPVKHTYTRYLYGTAYGLARTDEIILPSPPTGPIRRISYDRWIDGGWVNAVHQLKLDYDPGQGPDGKDSTGVMGVANPAPNQFWPAISTVIDGIDVVTVQSWVGDIVDGLQFTGTWNGQPYTTELHGWTGNDPMVTNSLPGHKVGSVYIDGAVIWNGATLPDVFVAGYRYDPD